MTNNPKGRESQAAQELLRRWIEWADYCGPMSRLIADTREFLGNATAGPTLVRPPMPRYDEVFRDGLARLDGPAVVVPDPPATTPIPRWRHKASGHIATELGRDHLQVALRYDDGSIDTERLFRFEDGRFERVEGE